eukprot:s101_g19.t3
MTDDSEISVVPSEAEEAVSAVVSQKSSRPASPLDATSADAAAETAELPEVATVDGEGLALETQDRRKAPEGLVWVVMHNSKALGRFQHVKVLVPKELTLTELRHFLCGKVGCPFKELHIEIEGKAMWAGREMPLIEAEERDYRIRWRRVNRVAKLMQSKKIGGINAVSREQGRMKDQRSGSLRGTLRAAYFLRAHSIQLECVTEASKDREVRSLLSLFCKLTGYHLAETELALDAMMPTKRLRWWCMLVNPTIPPMKLHALPRLSEPPVMGDMLPMCPPWPAEDIAHLELDLYESNKFEAYGGIDSNLVRSNTVLRTALHGWANQLTGCPCQCRKFPLSEARLQQKGLFGALIALGGYFKTPRGNVIKTRHLHPWEMCIVHGGIPEFNWTPLRYSIAALGQMASPVQSCWITGQFLAHYHQSQDLPVVLPEIHLWNHFTRLFSAVASDQPNLYSAPAFQTYMNRIRWTLQSRVQIAQGPMPEPAPAMGHDEPDASDHDDPCKGGHADNPKFRPMSLHAMPVGPLRGHGPSPPESAGPTKHTHGATETDLIESDSHVLHEHALGHGGMSEKTGIVGCPPDALDGVAQAAHDHLTFPTEAMPVGPLRGHGPSLPLETMSALAHEKPVFSADATMMCQTTSSTPGAHPAQTLRFQGTRGTDVAHPDPIGKPPRGEEDQVMFPHRPMSPDAMPEKPLRGPGPSHSGPHEKIHEENSEAKLPGVPPAIDNTTGGLVAFASPRNHHAASGHSTNGPKESECTTEVILPAAPAPFPKMPADTADEVGLTQAMLQVAIEVEQTHVHHDPTTIDTHEIQVIRQDDMFATHMRIKADATVGSITVAEAKMGSLVPPICVNTSVGTRIPSAATTTPYQQVFLKEMAKYGSGTTREAIRIPLELFDPRPIPRISLLYRQEGFVASDEMAWYLRMVTATGQATSTPAAILPEFYEDEELELRMQNWFAEAMLVADAPCTLVTAIYAHFHWFPVGIRFANGVFDIFTTPGGRDWVQIIAKDMPKLCTIHTREIGQSFPNDCGFQCVAWLISFVFDTPFDKTPIPAVSAKTAEGWRSLFEHHLHASEAALQLVAPTSLAFGGTSNGDVMQSLCHLIQQHGVPTDLSQERANVIMEKLGRVAISKTLRGTQPWRELKQLANQCSPKLQLILPSELQAVIDARTAQQQQFGSKKTKKKMGGGPKKPIQLAAEDIGIPEGIFQDAMHQGLHQVPLSQIGPETCGIVVVNVQQAIPYLKFAKPISKFGLALLVIDPQDPALHGIGDEIRFPARCERTSEPLLMSAKLVQLGSVLVSRTVPERSLKVEEVRTVVLRFAIYKDETEKQWDHIITRPVKHLVNSVPILGLKADGTSPIIDLWDRQYLNDRMERVKPESSTTFLTTFRIESCDVDGALKSSGTDGIYAEPRSADGRSPSPEYRVVWLNKQSKQSVLLASQATSEWTCVVRAGHRFGLRCHRQNAQKVHEHHKPQTPFLESDQLLTFHAGPFPHGANRAALIKLFSSWSWQARPCQPKSRTPDGKGVVWECQAAQKPPFEVYQLEHADVLITEITRKPSRQAPVQADIQASAKTIAALKAVETPGGPEEDLLQTNDPWASYSTPVKAAKRASAVDLSTPEALDTIAAKVQHRLTPVWQQLQANRPDGDHDMSQGDERVQEMEDRLAKLEQTVTANHKLQSQNTQELAAQITKVQQNVEQQGRAFHAHLDDKLDQQLQQIEQILSKRTRME